MRVHRKDYSSRRGLEALLNQRRKLLQYLRRSKFDKYAVLISRIGLKDSYGPQDRLSARYKARGAK
jgi:small subunit ribosomal protein S15